VERKLALLTGLLDPESQARARSLVDKVRLLPAEDDGIRREALAVLTSLADSLEKEVAR
jgi:hypothetical protein